ncbi:serine/arginine repetitive matrix protein 2-like isoform X1 [Ananas comosus]|uniref:Serine/arginine repetitive matrix protein 2-like isoform X1 n=1 Tax=Ananas comosus TaxID=4615 RepID=A0A6P5EGB9_ANACO|nr:serine/arginine repetitive matrix protein 2-like isoform X1 [Ananas comosus]
MESWPLSSALGMQRDPNWWSCLPNLSRIGRRKRSTTSTCSNTRRRIHLRLTMKRKRRSTSTRSILASLAPSPPVPSPCMRSIRQRRTPSTRTTTSSRRRSPPRSRSAPRASLSMSTMRKKMHTSTRIVSDRKGVRTYVRACFMHACIKCMHARRMDLPLP